MRGSNLQVDYTPTGLKKIRTRILKHQGILHEINLNDTNVYAINILENTKLAHINLKM